MGKKARRSRATLEIGGLALTHRHDGMVRRADVLTRTDGEGRPLTALAQRVEAAAALVQVEFEHGQRIAAAEVAAGMAERARLEAMRAGEVVKLVDVPGAEGVKRLSSGDGLLSVTMTADQRQAGFRYRDIYRGATIGWSSPLDAIGTGGRGSGLGMDLARVRMGQRMRFLQIIGARVAGALSADHVAVLQAVAGEGKSVREHAPASRARARASAQLLEALDFLAGVFARPA